MGVQGQSQSLSQTHAQTQMQAQAAGYNFGANPNAPSRGGMSSFNSPFGAPAQQGHFPNQAQGQQSTMDASVAAELNNLHAQTTGATAPSAPSSHGFGQPMGQGGFGAGSSRPFTPAIAPGGKDPFAYEDTPVALNNATTPAHDTVPMTSQVHNAQVSKPQESQTPPSSGLPFPAQAPTLVTSQEPESTPIADPFAYREDSASTTVPQATEASALNIVNVASEAQAKSEASKSPSVMTAEEREQAEERASFFAALDKPISELKNIKSLGLGTIRPVYRSMFAERNEEIAKEGAKKQESQALSQAGQSQTGQSQTAQTQDQSQTGQDSQTQEQVQSQTQVNSLSQTEGKTSQTEEVAEFTELDKKYLFDAVAQGRDEAYAEAERIVADFNLNKAESKLLFQIVATMLEQHQRIAEMQVKIAETEAHYRETLQEIEAVKNDMLQEASREQRLEALRSSPKANDNQAQAQFDSPYRGAASNESDFGECPDFDDMPWCDCPPEYQSMPSVFDDPDDYIWAQKYQRAQANQRNQAYQGNQGSSWSQGSQGAQSSQQPWGNQWPNTNANANNYGGNAGAFQARGQNTPYQGGQNFGGQSFNGQNQGQWGNQSQGWGNNQGAWPQNSGPQSRQGQGNNWSQHNGQGQHGGYGQGNFNQGGQANHGFGHNGFNSYDQNEARSGNLNNDQQADNSPQGRNYFRPQKVDPTLGQGNFNNLVAQSHLQGENSQHLAQVEEQSSNQAVQVLNGGTYAMSSDYGRDNHALSEGFNAKHGELDLSEISLSHVADLERRILEKGALQDKSLQNEKKRLREQAIKNGLTEAELTLDLDPDEYDINGLPYDDFAKYGYYDEPFAYPESLGGSGRSTNEIGLGPEGGIGEGFNLPSKQQRAQEAARLAALKASMPEVDLDELDKYVSDSKDDKDSQDSKSINDTESQKDEQEASVKPQASGGIYTGRKTNLPTAEDYGNVDLKARAVESIDLQNASLDKVLNLNLRPTEVIDDELSDREFFSDLFGNLADFIYGMHQAKHFILTESVNVRTESKQINNVLDNLAEDMIRASDIQMKLAAGEITRQEAEIAMGRLKPEDVAEPSSDSAASTASDTGVLDSGASGVSGSGEKSVLDTSDTTFSLAQQGVDGVDVNDPRYLGAKLMGSVSLQAQRAQAKDGERSAVDPEGLIAVPDFSSTQPLVLNGQDASSSLTHDIRSAEVAPESLNENQPTGGTVGESSTASGTNLSLSSAPVPTLDAAHDGMQPQSVTGVSSDFNPRRAQTSQLGSANQENGGKSAEVGTAQDGLSAVTTKESVDDKPSEQSSEIVERKQELELKPQEQPEPNLTETIAIKTAEFEGENEKAKLLKQQQAQHSLNSLVSSIRAQEGHSDFNIDDIFGSSLSDDKPATLTINEELGLSASDLSQRAPSPVTEEGRASPEVKQEVHKATDSKAVDSDLPPWEESKDSQAESKVEQEADSQGSLDLAQQDSAQVASAEPVSEPAPSATPVEVTPVKPSANAGDSSRQKTATTASQGNTEPGVLLVQNQNALSAGHGVAGGLNAQDNADRCAVNLGNTSSQVKWGSESNNLQRGEQGKITLESDQAQSALKVQSGNTPSQTVSPTKTQTAAPVASAPHKSSEPPTLSNLMSKMGMLEQGRKDAKGKSKGADLDSFGILNALEKQMETEIENKVVYAPSPWSLAQSAVIQIGDRDVPLSHMDMPAPVPINRNNQIGNLHKFEEEVPFFRALMDPSKGYEVSFKDLPREVQAGAERIKQQQALQASHRQEWAKWRQSNSSLGQPDVRGQYYLYAGNAAKLSELQQAYNEYMRTYSRAHVSKTPQELQESPVGPVAQASQVSQIPQPVSQTPQTQQQGVGSGNALGQGMQGTPSQNDGAQAQPVSAPISVSGASGALHVSQTPQTPVPQAPQIPVSQIPLTPQSTQMPQASQQSESKEFNAGSNVNSRGVGASQTPHMPPKMLTPDAIVSDKQQKLQNAEDEAWDIPEDEGVDVAPENATVHTTPEAYQKALEALDQQDSNDDDSTEHTNFTTMELDVDAFKQTQEQGQTSGEATDVSQEYKVKLQHYDMPGMRLLNQDDYLNTLSESDEWYQLILATFPDKGLFYGLLVNVERQVDPSDAYHWRLLVDKDQVIGDFSDKIWKDVQERFEQHLNHKLNLEFATLDVPSPNCPVSKAEALSRQAIVVAKQNLQANKGLNQLMQLMGENMDKVNVELYVPESKALVVSEGKK